MESYGEMLSKHLDKILNDYIEDISNRYNLNKTELRNMWNNIEDNVSTTSTNTSTDDLRNDLSKKKKNELVEMCKEFELDHKGNKDTLISRIVKEKTKPQNIIRGIKTSINSLIIKRNKWDNYEHLPTRFVFNPNTKIVFGKQENDGKVSRLTKQDIDLCNQYKFKFMLPSNLNEDEDITDDDELNGGTTDYDTDDDTDDEV